VHGTGTAGTPSFFVSMTGTSREDFAFKVHAAMYGVADAALLYQLLAILHLLGGFSSEKAKLRPAMILYFGLLTCFFGSSAVSNISSIWFSFFSVVFVWILSAVFAIFPESPARTMVVAFFDYGCAVFTFVVYSELPDRLNPSAILILICGILQILHIVFFAGLLVFALCFSCFRWCCPAGNRPAQIAPAPGSELEL
jgi:hypothetical protein